MVVATIGEVTSEKIISGRNVKPGDVVIGLRSSGIHSNGVSLGKKNPLQEVGRKIRAL